MAWIIPGTLQEVSWTKKCWWNPDFCDIPDFNAVGLLPSCAHAISGNSCSCENRVWNKWGRSHSPFVHSWKFNCNIDHCSQRLLSKEVVAGYSDQINSNACWGNISFQVTALDVFNCLFFIKGSCKYQVERKIQIQRTTDKSPSFIQSLKSPRMAVWERNQLLCYAGFSTWLIIELICVNLMMWEAAQWLLHRTAAQHCTEGVHFHIQALFVHPTMRFFPLAPAPV